MLKHMFDCDKIVLPERKKGITKQDCCMIFGIVMIALLFLFSLSFLGKDGGCASVFYDGQSIAEISLDSTEEHYYLIHISGTDEVEMTECAKDEWHDTVPSLTEEYNLLICKEGRVQMVQSSCPDKICVHHTGISKVGESIICLPHRLVVEITNGKENELDGVVY